MDLQPDESNAHWIIGLVRSIAFIEASSGLLEINRDDLNGTIAIWQDRPTIVLYDTVPGGAGINQRSSNTCQKLPRQR